MISQETVGNEEIIARILHREWVVDGELQLTAFALADGETYLSVNRLSIDSFADDVHDFVSKHPDYKSEDDSDTYQQALLQVADVREISVAFKEKVANLTVEVEPRDAHYKSHAGIFTRIEDKNIKGGQQAEVTVGEEQVISYEDIRQKVYLNLLQLSELQRLQIPSAK